MRIFVSYRRTDVGGHAGRLSDTLVQRLGAKNVFQDITAIAAGRDFASAIREALDACDAAVAVIGPGWLTASTPEGRRRLHEPDDYVRLELATVLRRDLPVVPVLVGGAALPAASDLPEDLRPLVQRQAIAVRDETWHPDVDHLLRSLRGESATPAAVSPRRRTGLVVGAVAAAVVVVVGLLAWKPWDGGSGESADERQLTGCPDAGGPEWTALPVAPGASAVDSRGRKLTVRGADYRPYKRGVWQVVVETVVTNDTAETVQHAAHGYESIIVAQRVFLQTCFDGRPRVVEPGTAGDGRTGYEVGCQPGGRIELILGDNGRTRLLVSDGPSSTECAAS